MTTGTYWVSRITSGKNPLIVVALEGQTFKVMPLTPIALELLNAATA
jgi:hypothetical protein